MTEACFYICNVTHRRMAEPGHALQRRLAYALVDVDAMDAAPAERRLLGVGRRSLLSVLAKDHGDGRAAGLGAWVRRWLAEQGVREDCSRIELLALPRMWGFLFNPISVFYIYDGCGRLHHLVYEVNNTFGGRKFYLGRPDQNDARLGHDCRKSFHVSPFFDVEGYYRFSLRPPEERLHLAIDYAGRDSAILLKARLAGVRVPARDRRSLKIFLGFPLMTLGVVVSIHWEALKMIMKGAKLRPAADPAAVRGDRDGPRRRTRALNPALEARHE